MRAEPWGFYLYGAVGLSEASVLEERLREASFDHFLERTGIVEELECCQICPMEEVLAAVESLGY